MNAIALMLDDLFADANLAVDAVYTPPAGGAPCPCRIIPAQPDQEWAGPGVGVTAAARIAELRVAEVPAVAEGGTVTVDGTSFTVANAVRPDAHRLIWRVELA